METKNYYSINGIPLTNPAKGWCLAEGSGVRDAPALRSPTYKLPGHHGDLMKPIDYQKYEAPTLTLAVHVLKNSTHEEMMHSVDELKSVLKMSTPNEGGFSSIPGVVRVEHHMEGENSRVAYGTIDQEIEVDQSFMRFATVTFSITFVEMSTVSGFSSPFENSGELDEIFPITGSNTISLGHVNPSAPLTPSGITVSGPFSSVTIHPYSSQFLYGRTIPMKLNVAVSAGEAVYIEPHKWTAGLYTVDSSLDISTYLSDYIENIVTNGFGPMFELRPEQDTFGNNDSQYRMRIITTSSTADTKIRVVSNNLHL